MKNAIFLNDKKNWRSSRQDDDGIPTLDEESTQNKNNPDQTNPKWRPNGQN
jgi:hypothetical protein